jgi:hypothetical protein
MNMDLEFLQKQRLLAKTELERIQIQNEIDKFFLGEPKKSHGKKKREKKRKIVIDPDWAY